MAFDLAAVRAELPLLDAQVYLNTGGTGPLPVPVARAISDAAAAQPRIARMGPEGVEATEQVLARLRVSTGALVGASGDDMAITTNTTTGLNIAIWGIDWRPGDHIITTELEHPGLSVPIAVAARRHGLRVTRLSRAQAELDLEAATRAHLTDRTRLIALSHVSWCTGAVLDVAGAARAAHAANALVVVDGAQSVGAIPVDAAALGVDAYAFPAQKWLLGPEGLGAVWIPAATRERVDLTFCAYEAGMDHQPDGRLTLFPQARRYEISTAPLLLAHGWLAGLAWLERLGWAEIHARVRRNQLAARAALADLEGVSVLTLPGPQAGLVVFVREGRDPESDFWDVLRAGVCLRWLVAPPALRASLGFFTTESDLESLAAGVRGLMS